MNNLKKVLLKIKENPNKYIGEKSIKKLNLFICGYVLSQSDENGEYPEELSGFQDFVQEKYNTMIAKGWAEIILFHSISDERAFDEFYSVLEEYHEAEGT